LKEYQRCVKNSMFSIGLKKLQKAHWGIKTLCNIHKTKLLSNFLFNHRKFIIYKMYEVDNLWDYDNKVEVLVDTMSLSIPCSKSYEHHTITWLLPRRRCQWRISQWIM
jgi:hypothetical protein